MYGGVYDEAFLGISLGRSLPGSENKIWGILR